MTRAAYGIALDLIRAGAQNVRVGRLPDSRNGQKVGIDDLILDKGVQAYPLSAYLTGHKFNPTIHKVVRNFLKVNARFLDYLEVLALPDLLDARPIEWWLKENRRLYRAIQAYVQQTHQSKLPELEVYVHHKTHASKGRGKTKKEAERAAFLVILEIMDGRRTVEGLPREAVTKIERALHMGTGKNYVGRVYAIAQILEIRPPQFFTLFHLTDEGTAYQTHASLQVTDEIAIETQAHALFAETSKQEAALKLLTRLSELIQPEDSSRNAEGEGA